MTNINCDKKGSGTTILGFDVPDTTFQKNILKYLKNFLIISP